MGEPDNHKIGNYRSTAMLKDRHDLGCQGQKKQHSGIHINLLKQIICLGDLHVAWRAGLCRGVGAWLEI